MGERFAPVRIGHADWQREASAELRKLAPHLTGRADRLDRCGSAVVTRVCRGCGYRDGETQVRSADCDLRICPRCARKRSQERRQMIKAAMRRLRKFRGKKWHFHTIPVRFNGETTVERLQADFVTVWKAWKRLWRFLRKKLGALMAFASLEVSPGGLVHVHVLAWHRFNPDLKAQRQVVMRALPEGSSQYDVQVVTAGKHQDKAIAELCKYLTKGVAVDARDDYRPEQTDPRLAAMVEVAFMRRRCWRLYGGVSADDMAAVDPPEWSCPACGGHESIRVHDMHPTAERLAAIDAACWARAAGAERALPVRRCHPGSGRVSPGVNAA